MRASVCTCVSVLSLSLSVHQLIHGPTMTTSMVECSERKHPWPGPTMIASMVPCVLRKSIRMPNTISSMVECVLGESIHGPTIITPMV